MSKELYNLFLPEGESRASALEQREKLCKEYEEAVKKFLENGANTDKLEEMTAIITRCCKEGFDILNMDELVKFLSKKLLNNDKSSQWEKQVSSVIGYTAFLGKISALYAMFLKKQEEIRKEQEYRRSIEQIDGLKGLLKKMTEDNIPFEQLCKVSAVKEETLNCILNEKTYFNVRSVGHQKMISLAPEGRKLKKYLKRTEAKRYSQEDVENYIYMNSHRLINMFRRHRGYLPKSVTVIPLSDVRQNSLSFEFKYVCNEISSRRLSLEMTVLPIDAGKISGHQIIDSYKIGEGRTLKYPLFNDFDNRTRRKKNAGTNISISKRVSETFAGNIAVGRI